MMTFTKAEAIKIVTSCAEKYRDELAGRSLLLICQDKHKHTSCIELTFTPRNFLHLTGLKVQRHGDDPLTAAVFYTRCLEHKLSPSDFSFSEDGTTQMKLAVLPLVISKNLSANMVGDYNSSKPKLYTEKLVGGVKACVGFVIDETSGSFVPNTVLKEDIRDNVHSAVRIAAIYRKKLDESQYTEMTYQAKKLDWSTITLPEEYQYLSPAAFQGIMQTGLEQAKAGQGQDLSSAFAAINEHI